MFQITSRPLPFLRRGFLFFHDVVGQGHPLRDGELFADFVFVELGLHDVGDVQLSAPLFDIRKGAD